MALAANCKASKEASAIKAVARAIVSSSFNSLGMLLSAAAISEAQVNATLAKKTQLLMLSKK